MTSGERYLIYLDREKRVLSLDQSSRLARNRYPRHPSPKTSISVSRWPRAKGLRKTRAETEDQFSQKEKDRLQTTRPSTENCITQWRVKSRRRSGTTLPNQDLTILTSLSAPSIVVSKNTGVTGAVLLWYAMCVGINARSSKEEKNKPPGRSRVRKEAITRRG